MRYWIIFLITIFLQHAEAVDDNRIDCSWFESKSVCDHFKNLNTSEFDKLGRKASGSSQEKVFNTINICQLNPELEICKKIENKKTAHEP